MNFASACSSGGREAAVARLQLEDRRVRLAGERRPHLRELAAGAELVRREERDPGTGAARRGRGGMSRTKASHGSSGCWMTTKRPLVQQPRKQVVGVGERRDVAFAHGDDLVATPLPVEQRGDLLAVSAGHAGAAAVHDDRPGHVSLLGSAPRRRRSGVRSLAGRSSGREWAKAIIRSAESSVNRANDAGEPPAL